MEPLPSVYSNDSRELVKILQLEIASLQSKDLNKLHECHYAPLRM